MSEGLEQVAGATALTKEPTERELLLAWYQLALYRRSAVVHGTISVFGVFQLARQHGPVEQKPRGLVFIDSEVKGPPLTEEQLTALREWRGAHFDVDDIKS